MPVCPFCFVDETQQRVFRKYRWVYIMQSNPSFMPYHMLVISNQHVAQLADLEPEEFSQLWRVAAELQKGFLAYGMGCDIRQNSRPFLKPDQYTVPYHIHIHVHVIPRLLNDQLYVRVQIHEKALFDERMLSIEQMGQEMTELKRILSAS